MTANNSFEISPESTIHPVVDDGVDAGVGHGQPVEEEVDVPNVFICGDGGIVVGVYEVDVVGSPTHYKSQNNYSKHFDNL